MTPKEFHLAVRGQQRLHGIDPDKKESTEDDVENWRIPDTELREMMQKARAKV